MSVPTGNFGIAIFTYDKLDAVYNKPCAINVSPLERVGISVSMDKDSYNASASTVYGYAYFQQFSGQWDHDVLTQDPVRTEVQPRKSYRCCWLLHRPSRPSIHRHPDLVKPDQLIPPAWLALALQQRSQRHKSVQSESSWYEYQIWPPIGRHSHLQRSNRPVKGQRSSESNSNRRFHWRRSA